MAIVVTGAQGFIGRNLCVRLAEAKIGEVRAVGRGDDLSRALAGASFVYHLAGVNRPPSPDDYLAGNLGPMEELCAATAAMGVPILFASSVQAGLDNAYGRSKARAEELLLEHGRRTGAPVWIARLTNVFGKWARPAYNSAVATFCHNIANDLPIRIDDPSALLRLVYVDDVVDAFMHVQASPPPSGYLDIGPVYETTVGDVADTISGFRTARDTLVTPRVGTGLVRALYSTFLTYLPTGQFAYDVPAHSDPRGVFVEMLKTTDSGQFSYFTARPGITRGEHYHHSKTEKFLVIQGEARFRFRHILTGERCEIETRGGEPRIVETIPGWTHDITNIGESELIVMLWANEVFDRARPDTIAMKVDA